MGTLATVTEVPVGVGPRTAAVDDGGLPAYVAHTRSNTTSRALTFDTTPSSRWSPSSTIDLATHRLAAHIEVSDNPRGIVLSPGGTMAFVDNTLAGTVPRRYSKIYL